jgi:chaperonin GroES
MIQPLQDYVLCKPAEKETKTQSGFFLTDDAARKPETSTIISTGELVSNFTEGDVVLSKSYAAIELKHGGENYLLIKEEDIVAKVTE